MPDDERPPISLADPSVIRALSHPARVVVIDELFSGRVATSTQLAALAGLSPSAMSYHLRAMAKLGIVERDESGTDGRERPWRACGSGITLTQPTSRAQLVASAMLVSTVMQGQLQAFERYAEAEPQLPPEWQSAASMTSYVETLTAAEVGSLTDELGAVIDRYRGRSADRPGVARVRVGMTVIPSVDVHTIPAAQTDDGPATESD